MKELFEPVVIDAGHKYKLLSLDGELEQTLTFVKRIGDNFPGNEPPSHPGTTLQSVIRCLIDRLIYLNSQISHNNNSACIVKLTQCLWLLEDRAAERHGYQFELRPEDVLCAPVCPHCGHVVCKELGNARRGQ